jgi:hypothetical protein
VIGDGESENRFPIVAHVATANGKARLGTLIVSGYVGEVTVLGKDERKTLRNPVRRHRESRH